jgi:outer membrane biosynthesis protein TonB
MSPCVVRAAVLIAAAVLALGCTASPAPAQATNPTVEALHAQVASLSQQLEQLQPSPTPVNTPAPANTQAPPTQVPTVEPTDEPTPTPEPAPTAVPEPTQRVFPTRTPRPILASDAAPCALGEVKGNKNSKIYHVPGGGSYSQTKANVECFATEAAALSAGYRRALN